NDLIRIIGILGEEKNASKIARAIVEARSEAHFETTRTLASIIETASPKRAKDKIHPATRAFQGLRIFVNDELRELARALHAAEHVLKPGGVMAVVSFHSLEDRIVKRFFADAMGRSGGGSRHLPVVDEKPQVFEACGKAMVAAGEDEIARNPRARSAKLRAARRTNAPARMKPDFSIFNLPNLPWIDARDGRQAMHGAV
ncbi:MAG: 16S rRNA (cytosine(1402)-N(4))-methyltransferase RsmH, partial [Pseudomonadota bacterium]